MRALAIAWLLLPLWLGSGAVAGLRLTEVYYNAPGDDRGAEWLELANLGSEPVALGGVMLGDEETAGGGEGLVVFPEGASLEPGGVIVVAASTAGFSARYGRAPDYVWGGEPGELALLSRAGWRAGGEIQLANGGDEVLLLAPDGGVIDALSYGDSVAVFDPPVSGAPAGHSLARVPADCDGDVAADWLAQAEPDPGTIQRDGACRLPAAVAPDAGSPPPIGAVQGAGPVAAALQQRITLLGVVTGLLEDRNAAGAVYYTLFIQDPPGAEDGDPATSDGMAVFVGRERPALSPGDEVWVSGQVIEYYGLTEISSDGLELRPTGRKAALPPPVPLSPGSGQEALEALEGMRVSVARPAVVVGPTQIGCSFVVALDGAADPRRIRRSASEPPSDVLPVLHTTDLTCAGFPDVATGDRVAGLVGPLVYTFDRFRLVQVDSMGLTVERGTRPAVEAPAAVNLNAFSVATFNAENLFDTVSDTGLEAEPVRGEAELALKLDGLAATIADVLGCPTLLGLQEVENRAVLDQLVARLEAACGLVYAVAHEEGPDARGIDTALLLDPRRAEALEVGLERACTDMPTAIADPLAGCVAPQEPLFSRPPLAVRLRLDGQPLWVVVNHLKSKRGDAGETEARRLAQAAHLRRLVEARRAAEPLTPVLVMGDLNDFDRSPAVRSLSDGGLLHNVLDRVPEAERYSYIYEGEAQLIDGLLATEDLAAALIRVSLKHVNADFPASLALAGDDAESFRRASDHDPALAVFRWPLPAGAAEAEGTESAGAVLAGATTPEATVGTQELTTGATAPEIVGRASDPTRATAAAVGEAQAREATAGPASAGGVARATGVTPGISAGEQGPSAPAPLLILESGRALPVLLALPALLALLWLWRRRQR